MVKQILKKHKLKQLILPILFLMTSAVHGDELDTPEPTILIQDQKQDEITQSSKYHEYNNRMIVFNLSHLCYERTKPNAFYIGIDYWKTYSMLPGKPIKGLPIGKLTNAEFRMGHNFFYNDSDHFTPIIGLGVFNDSMKEEILVENAKVDGEETSTHYYKYVNLSPVSYGTIGFLYDHEFNSIFNLGLNVKGIFGEPLKNKYWGDRVKGYNINLPITFRFGHERHWDLRIEPFYLSLRGDLVKRKYLGFTNAIGYRF